MKKSQLYLGMFLSALLGALLASLSILYIFPRVNPNQYSSISGRQQRFSLTRNSDSVAAGNISFVRAASRVTPGVVHIRTLYASGRYSVNPLENLFRAPAQSTGSGVIITDDGYIVTNNHVIEDARRIEVVLYDNRSYTAELIGNDPTTDLALLKINAQGLPFVVYGNSDKVFPGEWVLAIGNPFDLNSTVTAGIVSAKARNIGILRDRNNLQIESFIQTDAAVNPGNSGGALVNMNGELIGINTAIATPNGSYAGYSFAVPVALVQKVMDDLLEFGEVRRGLLGIAIGDVNAQIAEQRGLEVLNGVLVNHVNTSSAAEAAGIKAGDVIVAINEHPVTNVSELQELVARNRPGDEVRVSFVRDSDKREVMAVLRDFEGNIEAAPKVSSDHLGGATFEELDAGQLERYGIDGGVRIITLSEGPWKDAGLEEGFIITRIDKVLVTDLAELNRLLEHKNGGLLVEGIFENGEAGIYGLSW